MRRYILLVCIFSLPFFSTAVYAVTALEKVGGVHITLYAPDWIWQGQNANVLVVAENTGDAVANLDLALRLPEGLEEHFEYAGPAFESVVLNAGDRKRVAFANIASVSGVSRQVYPFEVLVSPSNSEKGAELIVSFDVETIRGAAVGEGLWAALLPAILAGLWCVVLGVYLVRGAEPGAWKTPSARVWSERADGAE